jgi:DMSO/TMAO reductase YedYZ molybdopterin-dependent catalytic subunit
MRPGAADRADTASPRRQTAPVDAATPGPAGVAEAGGTPVGRRVVLGMMGVAAAGVLVGARVQDVIARLLAPVEAADSTGLTSLIPGSGRFRIYSVVGYLPHESDAAYRLTVDGLVDHPMTLTLDELKAMPATHLVKDFQCVTGWRVPSVPWTGVQLGTLLDVAGVASGARALTFTSFDGTYTESLTLEQARRSDVIVAYAMDGNSVAREHGGPVRLYVAPMYGYKSCKWLSRITAVPEVQPGYWEQEGYDVDAWVGRSNGRDDHPTS